MAVLEESLSSSCLHPSPLHISTETFSNLGIVHTELMLLWTEVWVFTSLWSVGYASQFVLDPNWWCLCTTALCERDLGQRTAQMAISCRHWGLTVVGTVLLCLSRNATSES